MSYDVLRYAILSKFQVVLAHRGYVCEVCPHVLGSKNGEDQVLIYQFAGGGGSRLPPGGEWRCMKVHDITNAYSRPGTWHTGHSHTRPETCVDDIDVEVAY